MSANIQAVRGMNDIVPGESALWLKLEDTVREVVEAYGFQQIRFPIVEKTELFCRSIGEVTDIVEKEMYTFEDRGKESKQGESKQGEMLSLRPEGTAGCVRSAMQQGLLHNQTQRVWYNGPMFRRERPQKGRYRQFHQIGVEAFGLTGPDIDIEMLLLTSRLWKALGIDGLRLEINSLGTAEARAAYRELLVEYFSQYEDQLDEDSKRRLHSNPLRILDTKNSDLAEIVAAAPSLADHLDEESAQHFAAVCSRLDVAGVAYTVNPRLVRGLDYYSRTVFEWKTDRLGAQDAVCSGGRYDGLVEQLGGKATPAVGFAMGVERLIALLPEQDKIPQADIYIVAAGDLAVSQSFGLAESLRDKGFKVMNNCGGGSFKSQFKKADRSGARWALVLGDDEAAEAMVTVKALDGSLEQQTVPQDGLFTLLSAH